VTYKGFKDPIFKYPLQAKAGGKMVRRRSFFDNLAISLVSFFIVVLAVAGSAEAEGLIAPGASVQLVSSEFQGTEGPATDADGNVYFSQMFKGCISKWSCADNTVAVYRENLETPNGLMFDAKGNLVICEMSGGRVIVDDMKGNTKLLADACNGEAFANPNDVWVSPSGGIYLTVFSMGGGGNGGPPSGGMPGGEMPEGMSGGQMQGGQAPGGQMSQGGGMPGNAGGGMPEGGPSGPPGGGGGAGPQMTSGEEASGLLGVFYISPDGKVTQVLDDISSPNGIIGTPDGKTLYVGDNGEGKTWRYSINADGTLSNKELFCESGTDGMAMDEKGNVYLTEGAVLIYSPAGKLIEKIEMQGGCSNVEFCGKDRKTLFITYHENVYTLQMALAGAPTAIDMATGR
jgi:sugar lactone lactonase YvrE